MASDLLTTGQVAKLCGVTPDAVLKWVRKGDLPATRTAGGHWRVTRETLRKLNLCRHGAPTPTADRCWEYFGRRNAPADACRECVVYRARAERCFEVARIDAKIGHKKRFCTTDCEACSFYQMRMGLAVNILVITDSGALIADLSKQPAIPNTNVRTARSGYESAAVIETFRVSLVVLDGAQPEVTKGPLLDAILTDDRLPGVKVVVCTGNAAFARRHRHRLSTIPPPLTMQKIAQIAKSLFHSNGS